MRTSVVSHTPRGVEIIVHISVAVVAVLLVFVISIETIVVIIVRVKVSKGRNNIGVSLKHIHGYSAVFLEFIV